MLVLSRKVGEQLRIDNHITLTILKVQGKTVRIGVDAPKNVHVLRGELPARHGPRSDSAPRSPRCQSRCAAAEVRQGPLQHRVDHRQSHRSSHADRWTVTSMKARTQSRRQACVGALSANSPLGWIEE